MWNAFAMPEAETFRRVLPNIDICKWQLYLDAIQIDPDRSRFLEKIQIDPDRTKSNYFVFSIQILSNKRPDRSRSIQINAFLSWNHFHDNINQISSESHFRFKNSKKLLENFKVHFCKNQLLMKIIFHFEKKYFHFGENEGMQWWIVKKKKKKNDWLRISKV